MSKYRTIISWTVFTVILAAGGQSAWADFVVTGTPPAPSPGAAAQPVTMAPIVDPADLPRSKTALVPAWHWKLAQGFGHGVPLGFACRQIVPAAVQVTYGPGVSRAMIVSWRGGKAWNEVLRQAVAPLGLHLVMTHMAVKIKK